jgi:hypothetical protein
VVIARRGASADGRAPEKEQFRLIALQSASDSEMAPQGIEKARSGLGNGSPSNYWQSARALAVHCPKPLATMLRMTEQT